MKNISLRYGVLGATASISLGLINWFTVSRWYGPAASQALGYLSMIAALMCVPLGIKYFRDHINGGVITFLKGITVGFGISGIAALVIFIYGFLFFHLAGDQFLEWNRSWATPEEIAAMDQQMASMPSFAKTSWFNGFMLGLTMFIIGVIISVISSITLRK